MVGSILTHVMLSKNSPHPFPSLWLVKEKKSVPTRNVSHSNTCLHTRPTLERGTGNFWITKHWMCQNWTNHLDGWFNFDTCDVIQKFPAPLSLVVTGEGKKECSDKKCVTLQHLPTYQTNIRKGNGEFLNNKTLDVSKLNQPSVLTKVTTYYNHNFSTSSRTTTSHNHDFI